MKLLDDIIAAIATPVGEGGISVIRVSGRGTVELVDKHFRGSKRLTGAQSHTLHHGIFFDKTGQPIDEVVVGLFRSPHSYTAEDVVEISCHGGVYVTRRVLESVIASGARLAEPGEFTKRAFLNGRIDLSQAEAVADLIKARSEQAHRSSLLQLQGSLSARIKGIADRLSHLCGLVELELDFVEENIGLTSPAALKQDVEQVISELQSLLKSFNYGRLLRDGVKVVLVGRPNAGKSSLLNALLDYNRAIVTEIPGTTRDTIEENITIDGILFRLVDTAGIRETLDPIEMEGVRRTKEQISQADICLYVFDLAESAREEDGEFVKKVREVRNGHQAIDILIGNKRDLVSQHESRLEMDNIFPGKPPVYLVSAKTREGIPDLTRGIVSAIAGHPLSTADSGVTVTNVRHKDALLSALDSLNLALNSITRLESGEVIAVDLRGALHALGTIVGTVTTDDILNTIFSKFCIGK